MQKRTNIVLDEELTAAAMKLTGTKSKREVVDLALRELVRTRNKKDLLDLAGKIKFYEGYDHKTLRRTRYDAD